MPQSSSRLTTRMAAGGCPVAHGSPIDTDGPRISSGHSELPVFLAAER